jgi:glucan phosphoethanolaminetransferase (alkaline phosphatase superfamily)
MTGAPLPSPASPAGLARLVLFFLGILLLLNLADDFAVFRVAAFQATREDTETPLRFAAVYAGAYLAAAIGLVVLLAHGRRVIRWAAYAATAIAVALFVGFKSVNGYGFNYHEASLIWGEVDFIPDALRFFARSYLPPVVASLALLWLVSRVARSRVPRIRSILLCLIPLAAVYANARMLDLTYSKVYQSPIPYRVALLAHYAYTHLIPYYGEREAPRISPRREPLADHVVLIMDESVSGDWLGVNGGEKQTTPFLASISDRLFNYGITSSISNLSSSTNLVLQSGVGPDEFPDTALRSLKNANVFSYFQAAGFDSFLIDNQIYSGRPNNLMTQFDLEKLDGHLQLRLTGEPTTDYDLDRRAIDHIERIIADHERSFTYLLKVGAHFPYDDKYPADETVFRPTLRDGGEGGNLEKTLNSYRNALRWSVDGFIRALFERFEGSDRRILMIYTADHGQSLLDAVEDAGRPRTGKPTRWPHGTPVDPPVAQAAVPLMLLGFGNGMEEQLRELYRPELAHRVSQFEIFPSLLVLAGYDDAEIRAHYHHSLFDASPDRSRRIFVSGNLFGIGGGFYNHELVRSSCYLNEFVAP